MPDLSFSFCFFVFCFCFASYIITVYACVRGLVRHWFNDWFIVVSTSTTYGREHDVRRVGKYRYRSKVRCRHSGNFPSFWRPSRHNSYPFVADQIGRGNFNIKFWNLGPSSHKSNWYGLLAGTLEKPLPVPLPTLCRPEECVELPLELDRYKIDYCKRVHLYVYRLTHLLMIIACSTKLSIAGLVYCHREIPRPWGLVPALFGAFPSFFLYFAVVAYM